MPFPQHDPLVHKCFLHSLVYGCVREYFKATHPLPPFSFAPTSSNITSTFTTLHVATLLWESVRMKLTLLKWGLGSPLGLLKLQSLIVGVKTPRIRVFFISLESYQSVDIENGIAWAICTFVAHVMAKKRVGNQTDLGACRWSVTRCWKVFEESYKFASDLILIRGLSKELWPHKVLKVQTRIVSGLLLGSPGTKSHSDVSAMERCKEYYMKEGGGFPWVRAVVSLVNPELLVTYPSTKGASENELTNLLVGLMHVRVSN
jgi:hypothetical protein